MNSPEQEISARAEFRELVRQGESVPAAAEHLVHRGEYEPELIYHKLEPEFKQRFEDD